MDRRCSQSYHINFNDLLRWDVFNREFDKLSVFCIWNVSVLFELVACWMLRELASKGCGRSWPYNDTYKDSQLNCTIFGHVCWTFFYLVFLNQNCTVFDICDTNAMTVLIRGSRELLCWWYFTNSFRLQTVGFPFLPGVREQQVIGLQIIRHLDVTYFLDSSRRGTSKRACCDTLICLTMLQCMM